MDTENQNKYISVMYKLYTDGQDGKAELIEETADRPSDRVLRIENRHDDGNHFF